MTHVTTPTEFSTMGSKQILRKTVSLANGGMKTGYPHVKA